MTINTTYKEAFMLQRKPDENRSKIFIVDNIFSRLFNEGFYLHSRITVQIFNSEAPVILFNIIGWGESGHKYSVMSHHSLARNVAET